MNRIAWAPTTTGDGLLLTAVMVASGQELDRDLYLSLLGERMQSLVNAAPDKPRAVADAQAALHEAGLFPDLGTIPVDEAGNRLVWSNPAIEERLVNLGVLPPTLPPLKEVSAARTVLKTERNDPPSGLAAWVAAVTRLP